MLQDFRYALRTLARTPGFTLVVIVTLALGIGANTAIFSIVSTAFLRALPYPGTDRLVHLSERARGGEARPIAYPNFLDWAERQDVFDGLAVFHRGDRRLKTARGTEIVPVLHVSAGFFDVLGVQPVHGRAMETGDDLAGAEQVAWLTFEAWGRLFGDEPDIVGRSLTLDEQIVTVAGVLPEDFRFHHRADLYTAIAPVARRRFLDMRENHSSTYGLARLAPGVTLEAARARMDAIALRLAEEHPVANKGMEVALVPLREQLVGTARVQLLLLLGAVGLVLLIACVNVANMLLARSFAREREIAIRTSLGATRWQLMRQLLVESLMLAAGGGAAGALVGYWAVAFARGLVPYQVGRLIDAGAVDPRVVFFVVAITLVTGVVFGLAPAWQLSHIRPVDALKQTTRDVRTVLGRLRLSDLLVVAQVALALVLLVGAGLMIRSLDRLVQVETGYDATRVLTLEVAAPPAEQFQRDPGLFTRHYERVLEPVQRLAGVEAAAVGSGVPFTSSTSYMVFYLHDAPVPAAGEFPTASLHTVSPDYFRAMGIPLLRGRVFDGTEPAAVLPSGVEVSRENLGAIFKDVTFSGVVSRRMADRFWPGEDPIGKRFRLGYPNMGLPWVEVVGVVGSTVQTGLDRGEETEFYLSLRQWPIPINMHLVVRSRVGAAVTADSIRAAIQAEVGDVPIRDVRVLAERIDNWTAGRRFNRNLFACFAGVALLLALIGLYGVLAFNVGRRTREVGIRMALGATGGAVVRSVVWRGMLLVAPGLVLGLGFAWASGRALQSMLFEITGSDPLTYTGGALLMLLTAVLAAYIPARRAARVDPLTALRAE